MVIKSSKFYPKSLPLVAHILEMVNEGLTSACIAREARHGQSVMSLITSREPKSKD